VNKKILCITLLIALSLNSTAAFANPVSSGIQGIQQHINNTNTQRSRIEIEEKIQMLDNEIQNAMIEIDNGKEKIAEIEQNITDTQTEIDKIQKEANDYSEVCKERMRVLYINGSHSYIEVLLDSEGIGDFISRLEMIKKILKFDKQTMEEYKVKLDTIEAKKKELEEKKTELASIQEKNEEKLKSLEKSKEEQQRILASYRPTTVNQEEVNRILSSLSSNKVPLSRRGSISSSAVVNYATNFLGTPYVWGGTSPSGFDCSGFTQYVYRHFGVNLPRVASDQQQVGYNVSISDLRPGDLVFVGYPAHHVGIYVGNGYMIHAPQTGDVVKLSPIRSGSNARRVN
jgi:cell wall-associated NlpC family hydrolase